MTKIMLALPEIRSPARSPRFHFRLAFNEERKDLNPEMVAFLRVYTLDIFSEQIAVVGSVFVPIFSVSHQYGSNCQNCTKQLSGSAKSPNFSYELFN